MGRGGGGEVSWKEGRTDPAGPGGFGLCLEASWGCGCGGAWLDAGATRRPL